MITDANVSLTVSTLFATLYYSTFPPPRVTSVNAGTVQRGKGVYLLSGSLQSSSFHHFSIPTLKVRFWKLKVVVTLLCLAL